MKKALVGLALALPLSAGSASAYTSCDPCAPITCDPCAAVGCVKKESRINLGGWVQMTYYRNAWGCENTYVRDTTWGGRMDRNLVEPGSGNSSRLGNVANTDFQVNQMWVFIEREMDTQHGFDWGFRADFAYGTDLWMAQSWNDETFDFGWGSGDYYGSIPLLYGEVGYKNLSVQIGRIPSLLGYEAFLASERFFVSGSNCYYTEPLSTTGILGKYAWKNVTLNAGWTMGNDTVGNRFGDMAITGGVDWALSKKLSLSYMFSTGYNYDGLYPDGDNRLSYDFGFYQGYEGRMLGSRYDKYQHTVVLTWNFAKRWTYVLQSDYLQTQTDNTYASCPFDSLVEKVYGVSNYLYYDINDKWRFGTRLEWMRQEAGLGTNSMIGYDFYGYTFALQWKPWKNLTLTGELRYDQTHRHGDIGVDAMPYDNYTKNDQFSGGISALLTF